MEKNIRFEKRLISFLKNKEPIELTVLGNRYKDEFGVSPKEEFPSDLQKPGIVKEYLSERKNIFHMKDEYSNGHLYTFLSLRISPKIHHLPQVRKNRHDRCMDGKKYWSMVNDFSDKKVCGGVWDEEEYENEKRIMIKILQSIKGLMEYEEEEEELLDVWTHEVKQTWTETICVKNPIDVMNEHHYKEMVNGRVVYECSLQDALIKLGYDGEFTPDMCASECMLRW